METKAVGIKVLRDNLSRYLKEARTGTRILVLDRDEVVAEIHEPTTRYLTASPPGPAEEMEKSGMLTRPKTKRTLCVRSPVRLPNGTAKRIVAEDREDKDGTVH